MEQYDLYENESFANQLREKAFKSKQFKLECFIKDFRNLLIKQLNKVKHILVIIVLLAIN